MATQHVNPSGVGAPSNYTHVVASSGGSIVFISGQIGDVVREGMDLTRHFISKPFNDEAVISAVRELIDKDPSEAQPTRVGHAQ
jgi:enamine deaminase RidA (YjgF/YER057c/UK114 family)